MKNIDKPYLDSIHQVQEQLTSSYNSFFSYPFDLAKSDISEVIILRLQAYYASQNVIKQLLGKGYAAAGADFFVETVLFFVKLYLKQQLPNLQAVSEREILLYKYKDNKNKTRRKVIRPDITIKDGENIYATIECKTQLGRSRTTWEDEYNAKKERLKQKYPNAKTFLLVMTENNWGGFGNTKEVGVEHFSLLKKGVWPTNYNNATQIRTRIELFLRLQY